MYDLELSKKEIDTILIALQDSIEKIGKRLSKMNCNYSELPDHLKHLWKDKEAYERHKEVIIQESSRQINEITNLEEKIENIL